MKRKLWSPVLRQEIDDGNFLITDEFKCRLLLFTADCKWYDVTPDAGLNWPSHVLWVNGRIYVRYWDTSSITMYG